MTTTKRILVTGATGKVGQAFIRRTLAADVGPLAGLTVRALCHNRMLDARPRASRSCAARSPSATWSTRRCDGVTHVLHLATCKETPETIMDVAVKGLFWLLEGCREARVPAVHPRSAATPAWATSSIRTRAGHRGAAAQRLSGLLRAVQGAGGGDARAVRHPVRPERLLPARAVDHGEGRLQVPALVRRRRLRRPALARSGRRRARPTTTSERHRPGDARPERPPGEAQLRPRRRPRRRDPGGHRSTPRREQQTFNICMDEPVDYGELGAYLRRRAACRASGSRRRTTPTWLDNAKAKFLLGWRPRYDLERITDAAFDYQRAETTPASSGIRDNRPGGLPRLCDARRNRSPASFPRCTVVELAGSL